jgi:hypothetical protein
MAWRFRWRPIWSWRKPRKGPDMASRFDVRPRLNLTTQWSGRGNPHRSPGALGFFQKTRTSFPNLLYSQGVLTWRLSSMWSFPHWSLVSRLGCLADFRAPPFLGLPAIGNHARIAYGAPPTSGRGENRRICQEYLHRRPCRHAVSPPVYSRRSMRLVILVILLSRVSLAGPSVFPPPISVAASLELCCHL